MPSHPILNVSGRIICAVLISAAVAAASYSGLQAWQAHRSTLAAAPAAASAINSTANTAASTTASGRSPIRPAPHRANATPERPALQASLWVDGSAIAKAGERVALPSGTAFQLRLQAGRTGLVRLVAENADGKRQTLWQTRLETGEARMSPRLRLQGLRGMERLWLLPENGPMESFAILHV